MRAKYNRPAILTLLAALGLCLLLAAFQLPPDHDSLSSLQKSIVETGTCTVFAGPSYYVIQADMAEIENDKLVLTRSIAEGDNSRVVLSMKSGAPAYAKSVSIRFLKEPTDMLELSLDQADFGKVKTSGIMCMQINRHWSLRQWFNHFRGKIMNLFV
jgi:hypothetical protein